MRRVSVEPWVSHCLNRQFGGGHGQVEGYQCPGRCVAIVEARARHERDQVRSARHGECVDEVRHDGDDLPSQAELAKRVAITMAAPNVVKNASLARIVNDRSSLEGSKPSVAGDSTARASPASVHALL